MKRLIGTWKFLFVNITGDPTANPYGDYPLGRIIFNSDGYMSTVITRADRAHLPNGTTWTNANDSIVADVVRPVTAYSGPYKIVYEGDLVFSHVAVQVSVNPEWIGTDQVRRVMFEEKNGLQRMTLLPYLVSQFLLCHDI
jgi:hypothetical protein